MSLENIAIIGGELALVFSGGREAYLPLDHLRRACPCAMCQGEPDALGRLVKPAVSHGPRSFELKGWSLVGGYAIQFTWGDGHDSGLYSHTYLERLADAVGAHCPFHQQDKGED